MPETNDSEKKEIKSQPKIGDTFITKFDDVFKSEEISAELDEVKAKEDHIHPAAIQLMSKVPGIFSRGLVYIILLFIAGAIVWASLVKTDVVVKGQAILVSEGNVEHIHCEVAGMISSINIVAGDYVQKGKIIMTVKARDLLKESQQIDTVEFGYNQAQLELKKFIEEEAPQILQQKTSVQAQIKSFEDIISSNQAIISGLNTFQDKQNEKLGAGRRALLGKKNLLIKEQTASAKYIDAQITGLKAEQKSIETVMDSQQATTRLWEGEYLRLKNLAAQKLETEDRVSAAKAEYLIALTAYNSTTKRYNDIPFEISKADALKRKTIAQYNTSIAEVDSQIGDIEKEREKLPIMYDEKRKTYEKSLKQTKSTQEALRGKILQLEYQVYLKKTELERKVKSSKQNYLQAVTLRKQNEKAQSISAPIEGIVTQMPDFKVGTFVKPGELIAIVASPQSKMRAQISVANKDIGELKKDMKVKLKFIAFPYQDFGIINAKIVKVSPDATVSKENGSVYILFAEFEYQHIKNKFSAKSTKQSFIDLKYGMLAQADIVQRRRTMISFVLDPIKKLGEKLAP